MSSGCPDNKSRPGAWTRLVAAACTLLAAGTADARDLKVCADPNNLPFSNDRGEGFENKIVELVARELKAKVAYVWWAQRRGFIRNTLKAGLCDVVPGTPTDLEMLRTTAPYYRSSYVFVTRGDEPDIASFDDPRLRQLRIGVQLIGDDGANPPPVEALGRRGIVGHLKGYPVYGDYSLPNPPARIIEAVARGEIDVAIAWGPLAGYFAERQAVPLRTRPVSPDPDGPSPPMTFDISMGVRHGEDSLREQIEAVLAKRRTEIAAILSAYGVPRLAVERGAQK